MTRREFEEEVDSLWKLVNWCNDEGCYVSEDIYSSESYENCIDDELSDKVNYDSWTEIRDWLDELPNGYDLYIRDDYYNNCGWRGLDDYDDFDNLFNECLEWGDENDIWDDCDEEEEIPYSEEDDDDDIILIEEDDDVSFDELFASCGEESRHFIEVNRELAAKESAEEELIFNEFLDGTLESLSA